MKRFIRFFYSLDLEKGLVFVTIGNFVSISLGTVLWFVLAVQMTANNYGSLNYYISIVTIFTSIGIMGLDTTLTTFVAKGVHKMVSESISIVLISGIVFSTILSLIFMSLPLILTFLGQMFFVLSTSEMLGRHHYKEFMIVLIIARLITLASIPLLFDIYGVNGALYGYAISFLPLSYRFFISLRKFNLSLSTLRPIKRFFFHSYALGIFKHLVYFSDKLIIMPLFGFGILGYYQFGIHMLTIVSIIPIILSNYLLPQEAGNKNIKGKKLERLGIFSSLTITIFLIILTPIIITNLFPSFENAILSTQIILLAGIPFTMVAIFNSLLLAREKSFHVFVASGIFLVMQYALIASLGSLYGLIGLSLSMVIASITQTAYLYLMKRKS
jgi:O-antigen/teichoic acid export membrane protein